MPDFIEVIQQTIQNAVEAMKLTDKATGTVEAGLILTDTVKERTVNVQGGSGSVAVREGLKPGDRVLMLRVQNGNQYIILSKIT